MSERIPTSDELRQIIREEIHGAFAAVGLQVEENKDKAAAYEDFRFLRRLREGMDSTANKVGMAIILAVVTGLLAALWAGVKYGFRS